MSAAPKQAANMRAVVCPCGCGTVRFLLEDAQGHCFALADVAPDRLRNIHQTLGRHLASCPGGTAVKH